MIHVLEDCLPDEKFNNVFNCIDPDVRGWYLANPVDAKDPTGVVSWGRSIYDKLSDMPIYDASVIIQLKSQRLLRKRLSLQRLHLNGQTSDQPSEFHIDNPRPLGRCYTVVLFTSPIWNVGWGGAFNLYDSVKNKYEMVPYIPNNAVLFDSAEDHFGESPNKYAKKFRTSIAFVYDVV